MFNLEQSIAEWRKQMLAAGIKSPVPLEELEGHLREEIERQVSAGFTKDAAFEGAVQKIGQITVISCEFIKSGGVKEMVLRKAKRLCDIAFLVLPLPVLLVNARFVNEWYCPIPPFGSDAAGPSGIFMLTHQPLNQIYSQFAGGRWGTWGTPWWYQSACIMQILLFSLILALVASFQMLEGAEDHRRQRRITWMGQFFLALSGLLSLFSAFPFSGLAMAAIVYSLSVRALRRNSSGNHEFVKQKYV